MEFLFVSGMLDEKAEETTLYPEALDENVDEYDDNF